MATGGSRSQDIEPDSNDVLKKKFQKLHLDLVNSVNPASVADFLFANDVISADHMRELRAIGDGTERCRHLMTLLHNSSHPEAFIQLRQALKEESAYKWIEDKLSSLSLAGGSVLSGPTRQPRITERTVEDTSRTKQAQPVPVRRSVARVLHTLPEGDPVAGVAVLVDDLYLVRSERTKDAVEVYDVNSYCLKRCLSVPGMLGTEDMTSCKRYRCLYISDAIVKCIHKLELNGKVTQWPVGDEPDGLSVTVDCNVLVTCDEVRKLKLFNAPRGDLITEIPLQSDVVSPWQAIQLATGPYVVCHGRPSDAVHRVCLIDANGKTVATYGGKRGSAAGQMNWPYSLAVDSDRFVFVADLLNKRVLLLSPNLASVCDVVSRGQAFKWGPASLCLDVNRRRLYVAESGEVKDGIPTAGRVVVFGV